MRMRGAWHLYRPGERWRVRAAAVRIRIDTDPWVALAVDVPDAEFVRADRLAGLAALARLGPDLLSEPFDEAAAISRIAAAGDTPISEVLLDQRVVSGIGNVLRSEVLYLAGLDPATPAARVPHAALAHLVAEARRVMRISVRLGERRTTGRAHPEEDLWVYQRAGRPCRRCGTPIASTRGGPGARALYWCPVCQGTREG